MKIVVKKAGQNPEIIKIKGELHEMQKIVGGYIEAFNVTDDILCVCNEEGKLNGLSPNFRFNGDVIAGDVFFCSAGEEDFEGLNDDQIKILMIVFKMRM